MKDLPSDVKDALYGCLDSLCISGTDMMERAESLIVRVFESLAPVDDTVLYRFRDRSDDGGDHIDTINVPYGLLVMKFLREAVCNPWVTIAAIDREWSCSVHGMGGYLMTAFTRQQYDTLMDKMHAKWHRGHKLYSAEKTFGAFFYACRVAVRMLHPWYTDAENWGGWAKYNAGVLDAVDRSDTRDCVSLLEEDAMVSSLVVSSTITMPFLRFLILYLHPACQYCACVRARVWCAMRTRSTCR
jgi:hypothetical protein